MLELKTPRGLQVRVPENMAEDPSSRFELGDWERITTYYEENGYVILKGLLSKEQCTQIRHLWESEVKPFEGFMYRQATARAERHVRNGQGWIMNPILNLQSVNPARFPRFRDYATNHILASEQLASAFSVLLRDAPKVVQSMYFEGNSATWEHQDSYYLDSETIGEMSAAWIALEDIAATAGRFFICPKSHKIRLDDHSLYNNIAENHEGYVASVVQDRAGTSPHQGPGHGARRCALLVCPDDPWLPGQPGSPAFPILDHLPCDPEQEKIPATANALDRPCD